MKDKKQEEIERLAQELLYHRAMYYNGEPVISDAEYDKLEEELRSKDPTNPILFMVGSDEAAGNYRHDPPMLSCQKATKGIFDVVKWLKNNRTPDVRKWLGEGEEKPDILVSYKVDGVSLSLVYEGGHLTQAATRGNGQLGEEVTANVMTIEAIPKTIPTQERINVRGELYMRISTFQHINEDLGGSYVSPRNLAAGTLKQKDPRETGKRPLNFTAFEVFGIDSVSLCSDVLKQLEEWGFESPIITTLSRPSEQEVREIFEKESENRPSLDFEVDGLIFRINDREQYTKLGSTSHHPRGMIALKFTSAEAITTIKQIVWQVGRTGVLTPVAELEPVVVAGATIGRATLHNMEFVVSNNIAAGDVVTLKRAGDVIPKIMSVKEKRGGNYRLPDTCPACDTPVVQEGPNILCPNKNCSDYALARTRHWVKFVDIKGLGPKNIEKLHEEGLVKHPADLYLLSEKQLVDLIGKNGAKIYQELKRTRSLPLATFLAGLGIDMVGAEMGRKLAQHFQTWEKLVKANLEELISLEGISEITAKHILGGVQDPDNAPQFFANGLTVEEAKTSPTTLSEEGKTNRGKIYVTGSVPDMKKDEVRTFVESKGYEWSSSVSRNLSLLVAGSKAGQAKLDKAEKLGVPVKSWEDFIANEGS